MMKMKKILKCNKAESTPMTIAVVLAILLFATVVWEFFRLGIVVQGVRDALQSSVVSVATTNYDEVYNGLREGYSGGYQLDGNSWQSNLDYYDVYARMDEILGTTPSGSYHIKEQPNGYEYRFDNLDIDIENTGIRNRDKEFIADVSVDIEVPLSFGWDMLPPLEMEVRAKATYMPKF